MSVVVQGLKYYYLISFTLYARCTHAQSRVGRGNHDQSVLQSHNLFFHLLGLVSRQSAALRSATQPEFGGKWGKECLNTRFPYAYPAVCGIQHKADLN